MRESAGVNHSSYGLDNHGLYNLNDIYWNVPTTSLMEQAIICIMRSLPLETCHS